MTPHSTASESPPGRAPMELQAQAGLGGPMSAVDHVYFAMRVVEQARDALKEDGVVDPGVPWRKELLAASQLAMCISRLMAATAEMSDTLMAVTLKLSESDAGQS